MQVKDVLKVGGETSDFSPPTFDNHLHWNRGAKQRFCTKMTSKTFQWLKGLYCLVFFEAKL